MIKKALADYIENPVLKEGEGTYAGVKTNPLAPFLARLWRTIVVTGAIALLLFLVWGAIDWLMSEGDQEKLKNARNKMIHAAAGMGLLAASYAIIKLAEMIFGFNILQITWPTPES
jgi:TRAP-type C4-dicarboxylate transport system permease small subunit